MYVLFSSVIIETEYNTVHKVCKNERRKMPEIVNLGFLVKCN